MKPSKDMVKFATDHPRVVIGAMVAITLLLAAMAGLPSIWPYQFDFLNAVQVNTDPEDMLADDHPVRLYHNKMKEKMGLHDMVVVGLVNEENNEGVFNPRSLHRTYELTQFIKNLRWPDPNDPRETSGVVLEDLIAPSTVDNIEQGGLGSVKFEWLMPSPPTTEEAAVAVRKKARQIPFLDGTLLSEDGRALGIYIPITKKDVSSRIYRQLNRQIPVLWLWGPITQQLNEMGEGNAPQAGIQAVRKLGRLAAFHADDRAQFRKLMLELAAKMSSENPAAGWDEAQEALKAWSDTAEQLRKARQTTIDRMKDENKSQKEIARYRLVSGREARRKLESYLAQRSEKSPWLQFARLYVASRTNTTNSAPELLESVRGFASDTASALSGENTRMPEFKKTVGQILEKNEDFPGSDKYHITGLPVAEDEFGVQMFKQMAISAPLAMLIIFILLYFFFRKFVVICSTMIEAMVDVTLTMSLLVVAGYTVHIMSSMIPIFIMPIAVLDNIHILSEFYDRYQETGDRKQAIRQVISDLFTPMLYTSLTTAAGFASLALTPIPPVQVFGIFVAIGVMIAWFWTIMFNSAYIMLISEESLSDFGLSREAKKESSGTLMSRLLKKVGRRTYTYAMLIIVATLALTHVAQYGILSIQVNDNPTKWFERSHPIRQADRVLNSHFGGTYMAYLALEPPEMTTSEYADTLRSRVQQYRAGLDSPSDSMETVTEELKKEIARLGETAEEKELSKSALLDRVDAFVAGKMSSAPEERQEPWRQLRGVIDKELSEYQIFKRPEVLKYIGELQQYLRTTGIVGKSNSLTDIVKTVHRELMAGAKPGEEAFTVPDKQNAVAQCLLQYQNSHRPQDLWHFTTPDYHTGNIWLQLKSGDNKDMSKVVSAVDRYMEANPPPEELTHKWFGLTYINVVWQQKMVYGMLKAFLGSFLVVLLLMILLFGSGIWGLLSMVPLTITIALVYGTIGLIGKDYDMPVAVLSSLSLGLAVDYAIHFLARSRQMSLEYGSWSEAVNGVFGDPARAITRNVIVAGTGFLPLLAAPLVPYKTVGIFIAAILLIAGAASLLILPAVLTVLEDWLFPVSDTRKIACKCGTWALAGVCAVGVVAVNAQQFLAMGWTHLTAVSIIVLAALLGTCSYLCRRQKCGVPPSEEEEEPSNDTKRNQDS